MRILIFTEEDIELVDYNKLKSLLTPEDALKTQDRRPCGDDLHARQSARAAGAGGLHTGE